MRFICISDEWDRLAVRNTNTVHQNPTLLYQRINYFWIMISNTTTFVDLNWCIDYNYSSARIASYYGKSYDYLNLNCTTKVKY